MTILRSEFNAQMEQVLSNVDLSKISKQYTRKQLLSDLIDWPAYTQQMADHIQPIIFTLLSEVGQAAMQDLGLDPAQFDPISTAITTFYTDRAIKIAEDVNDETEKQLRATITEAVSNGEAWTELSARVQDVFGNASTVRADRIARTETSRAQTFGDLEAWKQSGVVESKEWFTAEDERVCPFCNALDGRVEDIDTNFFDKGDTFEQGDDQSLSLSYDDVPGAPLHVNCRCVLLPVRDAS